MIVRVVHKCQGGATLISRHHRSCCVRLNSTAWRTWSSFAKSSLRRKNRCRKEVCSLSRLLKRNSALCSQHQSQSSSCYSTVTITNILIPGTLYISSPGRGSGDVCHLALYHSTFSCKKKFLLTTTYYFFTIKFFIVQIGLGHGG